MLVIFFYDQSLPQIYWQVSTISSCQAAHSVFSRPATTKVPIAPSPQLSQNIRLAYYFLYLCTLFLLDPVEIYTDSVDLENKFTTSQNLFAVSTSLSLPFISLSTCIQILIKIKTELCLVGSNDFPLCCSVQGRVALLPWRPHLGGSSVSFRSPHLSAYATLPYTQPPPGARVAAGCKERCLWAVTPLPAQVTAPRSRAWQDCLITQPPLLTASPFVSRVFARICHVHLTQIPFGARQARLAPSCIQARAWLPSSGDRSSRIASTPSPRRVDQLG